MGRGLILALCCACLMAGCRSHQAQTAPPVVLHNSDSVRLEQIIATRLVPVDVKVAIPQQSETKITVGDSSHVETDVAESDAWINPDGTLGHSIKNKPETLDARVMVPQTSEQTTREAEKVREVPVPQPYPVEVERKLTRLEQIKLAAFWPLVMALAGFLYT